MRSSDPTVRACGTAIPARCDENDEAIESVPIAVHLLRTIDRDSRRLMPPTGYLPGVFHQAE
jgi:hypothetical protein